MHVTRATCLPSSYHLYPTKHTQFKIPTTSASTMKSQVKTFPQCYKYPTINSPRPFSSTQLPPPISRQNDGVWPSFRRPRQALTHPRKLGATDACAREVESLRGGSGAGFRCERACAKAPGDMFQQVPSGLFVGMLDEIFGWLVLVLRETGRYRGRVAMGEFVRVKGGTGVEDGRPKGWGAVRYYS